MTELLLTSYPQNKLEDKDNNMIHMRQIKLLPKEKKTIKTNINKIVKIYQLLLHMLIYTRMYSQPEAN